MLPQKLRIDNPKIAEAAEQMRQELAQRAQSPFAQLSPQEHARARAYQISRELQAEVNRIGAKIVEGLVRGEDVEDLKAAQHTLACQLAENLAVIGDYQRALEVDPREEHRREYVEIIEAINCDDADHCDCPLDRQFAKAEVFSERHGRVVTLVKCRGCGFLNAMTTPPEIARLRDLRQKARSLVGGLSPAEAAEKLRAVGHTAGELL